MIDQLVTLVGALREELEQYGEMLALLDRQQQQVIARAADEVFQSIGLIKSQGIAIQTARERREDCREMVAECLDRNPETPFAELIPLLPADYQPLVKALVQENNELLVRVRQRARQNHLLLSRSLELMQGLINSLFPGRETRTYNDQGEVRTKTAVSTALYEAVG
jgi:flagellar biosynthesis/type III secretory pathway chaperone